MDHKAATREKTIYLAIAIICFGALGGLTGRRAGGEVWLIPAYAVGGLVFA